LSPELQSAAVKQALEIQAAPLDAAYKSALTNQLLSQPSFEQRAGLQLMNTLLGKSGPGAGPGLQRVSLNVGPDGKQTSPRDKHIWSYNPQTGQPEEYIGPDTQAAPQPGAGIDPSSKWLQYDRNIRQSVMQEMAFAGLGKLVTLPNGDMTINFNNPSRDLPEYQRRVAERVRYEQGQGRLPENWFSPEGNNGGGEPEEYLIDSVEQAKNVPIGKIFDLNGVRYRRTNKGAIPLE